MRRFSFLATLFLGFSVIVAPSAYGDEVVKVVIKSALQDAVSIEGVTSIAITMDEPLEGETWGLGLSSVDYDFWGLPVVAVVDDGADWTNNGWSDGEITWTGTDPLLPGGTLEVWAWASVAPLASINVVTDYEGVVNVAVTESAEQPWAPDDTFHDLTITFIPPGADDFTPPVVTLLGEPYIELEIGDTYTEAGATALDDVDGDVTASITTDNPVDTAESYAYAVTYTATDATGNEGTATRDVVVLPADDTRDYADETASAIEKIVQDAGCFVNSVSADAERNSHFTMMVFLIGLLLVCVAGNFTEKRTMKMLLVLLVGAGLLLGGSPAVHAQETAKAVDAEETEGEEKDVIILDELVVTATKREMDIMDVPVAVSAFGHQKIEELGMTNMDDLEQLVPGLQFGESVEGIGHGIVMRGIGSMQSAETHRDLAVAVYVDGIYSHGNTGVAPNLFDIERVEVGRGPQGTLHGRNSIAGSISYHTKKPTMEWDADILAEFTDQVTERFNMAFGGPIIGGFSFRVTGGRFTGDGSQKNVGFGGDYGVPDETTISPQLRFKNDRFDINLSHTFTDDQGVPEISLMLWDPPRDVPYECSWTGNAPDLSQDAFVNVRPGDFPGEIDGYAFDCFGTPSAPNSNWFLAEGRVPAVEDCGPGLANECDDLKNVVSLNRPGGRDMTRESWTFNADAKITEWLTLRYTYGESQMDDQNWFDGDQSNRVPSAADPTLSADGGVPYEDIRQYSSYLVDGASHEIQLFSYLDGPLNFILGYYTYENYTFWEISNTDFGDPTYGVDTNARAQALGFDDCADAFPSDDSNGHWGWEWGYPSRCNTPGNEKTWHFSTDANSKTEAAFGSVDYEFNDQWRLSAGLRWTEDTRWRDRDLLWIAQELYDVAGTGDLADDLLIVWIADEKAVIEGSNQRPSWDAWIWNISAEYRPIEGTMVYGRISTGYRAGGFNSASTYNPPIEEETLINYEIGLKGLFLDNRLNIRATGFYQDYNDYQITAQTLHPNPDMSMESPVVEFTDNIDGTFLYGLELESSFWINDSLRVSAMFAYQESELGTHSAVLWTDSEAVYEEWTWLDQGVLTETVYQHPRDFSGGRLPMQPQLKGAVTLSYETPVDLLKGTVQLLGTGSYTGKRYPYAQNIRSQVMAEYERLDLRAGWTSYDQHWSVVLYVQNALDDVGLSEYLPDLSGSGYASGALTDPRQFGIVLRWKW